jgi:hypothetical protein
MTPMQHRLKKIQHVTLLININGYHLVTLQEESVRVCQMRWSNYQYKGNCTLPQFMWKCWGTMWLRKRRLLQPVPITKISLCGWQNMQTLRKGHLDVHSSSTGNQNAHTLNSFIYHLSFQKDLYQATCSFFCWLWKPGFSQLILSYLKEHNLYLINFYVKSD